MTTELHQPFSRRAAILRILREGSVHKQVELVKVLKKQGFEATQSSVSRDLKELGVAKAGDRYIIPAAKDAAPADPFASVARFVLEMRTAGASLTILKTMTGAAPSVTVAIDKARWPFVAGTISGDDTIFIATEDVRDQRKLTDRLRTVFNV